MNNVVKMLITLGLIGVISGGALSQLSGWAEPLIAIHRKAETERAIFVVQPNGSSYKTAENLNIELFKVYNEQDSLIGYAIPMEGNGFQGKIRVMAGISSDLSKIIGIEVLEQVETPGLGTKITEEDFLSQFEGLSAVPKVDWVKGAPPTKDNQIQAITGATISSKAIVQILNEGIAKANEKLNQ